MSEKINGEDILFAIGDLPIEYLDIRTAPPKSLPIYKKLTIAASVALFVGIFAVFLVALIPNLRVFDPAKGDSSNGMDGPSDLESSKDSETSGTPHTSVMLDISGNIIGSDNSDVNNSLPLKGNDLILITISANDAHIPSNCIVRRNDGSVYEISPIHTTEGDAIYELEINESLLITFFDTDSNELFKLMINHLGTYAEFEVIKNESELN